MGPEEFFAQFQKDMGEMKQQTPDLLSGFSALFSKVIKDGALTVREKELIALGIGMAEQCEPCIMMHIKKALEAGATKEQVLEAAAVAVVMDGGPAYMHIPVVIKTVKALEGE